MVLSRGGVSGGLTITDALHELEARGYGGQFLIRPEGRIECRNCGKTHQPRDVPLEAMRRIEGVSDPADMVFIGALRCPACGETGTATMNFGPHADASDAAALRGLDNQRRALEMTQRAQRADESLVSDTGWLKGPDDR